jgi:hypothetical protein
MLAAQKENLESGFRQRMLRIRDKELDFFTRNCQSVAQLSALIAGFAYSGLIYVKYIDVDLCGPNEILCAEILYPIMITITMSTALFAMWGATLITMLAPGLALRGPQGSMNRCVDMVVQEYQYTLFLFTCALVGLLFSCIIWSWTQHFLPATVSMTLTCLAFCYFIWLASVRSMRTFDIPRAKLITGRFDDPNHASATADLGPRSPHREGYSRLPDGQSDGEDEVPLPPEPIRARVGGYTGCGSSHAALAASAADPSSRSATGSRGGTRGASSSDSAASRPVYGTNGAFIGQSSVAGGAAGALSGGAAGALSGGAAAGVELSSGRRRSQSSGVDERGAYSSPLPFPSLTSPGQRAGPDSSLEEREARGEPSAPDSELAAAFAAAASRLSPAGLSQQTLLAAYSFYKQATEVTVGGRFDVQHALARRD